MTKRQAVEWKCSECGAYGVEANRQAAIHRFVAHWVATHMEVPF